MQSTPANVTVATVAEWVNGRVVGDAHLLISGVSSLHHATSTQLSFLSNRRYVDAFQRTKAGVVLVTREEVVPTGQTVIRCNDPYLAFAQVLENLHPPSQRLAQIHPMSVVSETAVLGNNIHVEPFVFIASGATVGDGCVLESGSRIGEGAVVGARCHIKANAVVSDRCILGDDVVLQPGAVVGADGFGFAPTSAKHHKIPQVGLVRIGDGVELGAHSCVDRPAFGETRIDDGVKTDNFVQIGHAAHVGANSLLVAYSGIAGSSRVGKNTVLAAKAAVLGHISLGDGVQVGAGSIVHNDQADGEKVSGYPAVPHHQWLRQSAIIKRLPQMKRQVDEWMRPQVDFVNELPHRYPFVFIDEIVELNPQQNGHAIKCVSRSEPYFQGHFPGNPIFPGVLQIEAMAQLVGAVALGRSLKDGEIVMLAGVDKVRFNHVVRPGMSLHVHCSKLRELKDVSIYEAQAVCKDLVVSSARITVVRSVLKEAE